MAREKRHDILFEPITLGPKVLKNRFWRSVNPSPAIANFVKNLEVSA
jgi:hypothetical protein